MPLDNFREAVRDAIESDVPTDACQLAVGLSQHRMQQSSFAAERLTERRSL
jgi:hypothetical protein